MKKKTCGIYLITSPTNCLYIGQSCNIEERWYSYKRYLSEGQTRLHNSFNKHGVENHKFEIIEECSRELLNEREVYWIKHFDSFDSVQGMNLQSGGGVFEMAKETKEKISKANKGMKSPTLGKVYSDEEKQKLSLIHTGKKKSVEAKKNMSKGQIGNKNGLGKKRTAEQKQRLSEANKGNIISEEQKLKLSLAMKGKKLTPESIRKREETKKRNRYLKLYTTQSIIFRSQIFNNWNSISKSLPNYII